jgi:hypothetical protein
VGPVALWGRVVVHAGGWRAEFAYPQRLGLICPACNITGGPADSHADGVAAYRDGSLVPLCERHLRLARICGSRRFNILSLHWTLAALADGYAVEPIAALGSQVKDQVSAGGTCRE